MEVGERCRFADSMSAELTHFCPDTSKMARTVSQLQATNLLVPLPERMKMYDRT